MRSLARPAALFMAIKSLSEAIIICAPSMSIESALRWSWAWPLTPGGSARQSKEPKSVEKVVLWVCRSMRVSSGNSTSSAPRRTACMELSADANRVRLASAVE